jgi:hypothetical protein
MTQQRLPSWAAANWSNSANPCGGATGVVLAGVSRDKRGGVGVGVRVDSDDEVDGVREDGHDAALFDRVALRVRSISGCGRSVMGHTFAVVMRRRPSS